VPGNPNDDVPLPPGCGPHVALSLLRQTERRLEAFLSPHGGGGAPGPAAGSPARRAAALAAAREHLRAVRARAAAVEAEMAAAGVEVI
jgi:hypothetical protein